MFERNLKEHIFLCIPFIIIDRVALILSFKKHWWKWITCHHSTFLYINTDRWRKNKTKRTDDLDLTSIARNFILCFNRLWYVNQNTSKGISENWGTLRNIVLNNLYREKICDNLYLSKIMQCVIYLSFNFSSLNLMDSNGAKNI